MSHIEETLDDWAYYNARLDAATHFAPPNSLLAWKHDVSHASFVAKQEKQTCLVQSVPVSCTAHFSMSPQKDILL